MEPTLMTDEERGFWEKLRAFPLDQPGAALTFTSRLAREQGWTLTQARRVTDEYRRFLFLAQRAGHPVSPPDAVDHAWHLHLLYTRSYWRDLCQGVLGRPLHHEPTEGGLAEGAKFREWYEATLSSYRRWFGEPPADIWPPLEERERSKKEQWVDVSRHWLVPKPAFLRKARPVALVAAVVLVAAALLVPGCVESKSVFDLRGPEFLLFYGVAFGVALVASLLIERVARGRAGRFIEEPSDPYAIAFLGGGGTRALDAALAALFGRKAIEVRRDNNRGTFLKARAVAESPGQHEVETVVARAIPRGTEARLRDLRRSVAPAMERLQSGLAQDGLVLDRARLARLRLAVAAPLVLLLLLGAIKVFVGLSRGRPVMFLVFFLLATGLALAIRLSRLNRRTPEGEEAWERLEGKRRPDLATEGVEVAALAVALGGVAALQAPGFHALHASLQRPKNVLGGESTSGCGSGCGSSCGGSGCGGGGCGGGGCGGCGGGGD